MKFKILIILLMAAALFIGACANPGTNQTSSPTTTSNMAPDFQLQDANGNTVSLSDYRGSPVMLHFWRID